MSEINEEIAQFFLDNQRRLFDEDVAVSIEEAIEFLEDAMAVVFNNLSELKAYWKEEGVDVSEMTDDDLYDALEVFALPDGRILLVEA